jgi:hypothetical protein
VWERREVRTRFWWKILKAKDHLGDPRVDEGVILKYIFNEFIWLKMETSGKLWGTL